MKVEFAPRYRTPYGMIEFMPVRNVPGFSHQIVVNGKVHVGSQQCQLGLPDGVRASRKSTVTFFMRVWCALEEGRHRFYYVYRNEDPPLPVAPVLNSAPARDSMYEPTAR
jgi:hypothetical protein